MKSADFHPIFTSFSCCPILTAPQLFKEGELMLLPPHTPHLRHQSVHSPRGDLTHSWVLMAAEDLQGGVGHVKDHVGLLATGARR